MITAVRIATLCSAVESDEVGVNLMTIWDYRIHAETRPGTVLGDLFLHVDVDITRTRGEIEVEAVGYREAFPFDFQTELPLTALHLKLLIPVVEPGPLKVSLIDAGRRNKPWRWRWQLAFASYALEGPSGAEVLAAAHEAADLMRASIKRTSQGRPN